MHLADNPLILNGSLVSFLIEFKYQQLIRDVLDVIWMITDTVQSKTKYS